MLLLTGAGGYIGGAVLRRLAARGERVCALLLPGESLAAPPGATVQIARGDITDAASLRAIPDGIDRIVHCAALMLPNDGARIRHVNVEGTRTLLDFARERQVRRFVYFSAVSAVYQNKNVYGESKAAAEALVVQSGLDYTILRPTMVYGRDGGLHFQQLVNLLRKVPGALPVLGSGRARLQPVAVEDVVRAVELVLDNPKAIGNAYGVAGATVVSFDQYVDRISAALGRRAPLKVHVPLWLCLAAAHMLERVAGPTFLSPAALRGVNEDATLDTRPFESDCSYAPVDLDTGLRRALGPG